MRTYSVRICLLAIFAAGLCFSTVQAQQPVGLVPIDGTWRYNQSGANLGTAWRAPAYDDQVAGWESGQALFAAETVAYPRPFLTGLTAQADGGPTTVYFRVHFNYTGSTVGIMLVTTNYIDDGMVAYLNGTELFRFNMGAGTISSTTQATAANPGGEPVTHLTNVISSALLTNDNVLAVEVHQNGTASTDVVFGMSVTAVPPTAIAITTQPMGQTVFPGQRATFTVAATGSQPQYRWFSNNVAIAGATAATYQTPITTLAMNGIVYHVVVSNALSSVRSMDAVLSVIEDRQGPRLLLAVESATTANSIVLTFDEPLMRDNWPGQMNAITNLDNYLVSELGTTNILPVDRAVLATSNVQLRVTTPWNETKQYVVTVNRLTDLLGNPIDPYTQIGLSFRVMTNIFTLSDSWLYNGGRFENGMYVCIETNWASLTYTNDNPNLPPFDWVDGVGVFANDQSAGFNPCSQQNFLMSFGPITYYFRKKFTLGTDLGPNVTVVLRHIVDDGAIFYLNGVEFYRLRMPAGAVNCNTRPSGAIADGSCTTVRVEINGSILRRGTNVLAAELHQAAEVNENLDVSFDTELSFEFPRGPTIPAAPTLRIARQSPTQVRLTWSGVGYVLQSASNAMGPWTNVPGVTGTSATLTIMQPGPQFFQLRNSSWPF